MLATRWPAAFSDPEWAFEVKWDGVRAIASWDGARLDVRSRTGRPIGPDYPELDQLAGLAPCVLDGEIVAFDDEGRPSFGRLQQRKTVETPISFMAFDLLFLGAPLVDEPWTARRERLASGSSFHHPLWSPSPSSATGRHCGQALSNRASRGWSPNGSTPPIGPEQRSADWRKVARVDQVRAVVGGYLPGDGSRASTFGSLLLGLVDDEIAALHRVGRDRLHGRQPSQRSASALDELANDQSPFSSGSDFPAGARFVEPTLVALVEFKEWTRAGKLRAPSFKGFTDDDPASTTWTLEGPPAP